MIRDGIFIDFEHLFQLVNERSERKFTEVEILAELENSCAKPRTFIAIGLIEDVLLDSYGLYGFESQGAITITKHLNEIRGLLGTPPKHPIEGYIEVAFMGSPLDELTNQWSKYQWEGIAPALYGSEFYDYQFSDRVIRLKKSITLPLLSTEAHADSIYNKESPLILFTCYQLEDSFPDLEWRNIGNTIKAKTSQGPENDGDALQSKIGIMNLRRAYLRGWLAGKGLEEPHCFTDYTHESLWNELGKTNKKLFAPSSKSLIDSLFENQNICSFQVGRRKNIPNN